MSLSRVGISDSFRDLFKADTSVLFGATRLVKKISSNPMNYAEAKTDNRFPSCLYIWTSPSDQAEFRMQNSDDFYSIDLRFVCDKSNPATALGIVDDAWERCKVLVRNEMYNGSLMTDYYTDTNAQYVDIEITSSDLPAPERTEDGKSLIYFLDSAITVQVNRWI